MSLVMLARVLVPKITVDRPRAIATTSGTRRRFDVGTHERGTVMRGQGRVVRPIVKSRGASPRVTRVWWLDYSINGRRFRESSGTRSKREALRVLRERIG